MADLVTRLRLDSSQHNQELDKAKSKVSGYKEEADKAGESLGKMGEKQTRSAKELLDAMSKIEGSTRSTANYRQQLGQITKQIQDLTINYRAMNQEMQDSDFGREVSAKITELTQKASEYKDAIMDAQQSVVALASDTANWDAMKQGIEVASSTIQSFISIGVLGEKTTEKLIAVLTKLKAVETATNAVIKIGNALQKQSALMLGISRVQAAALAKAKSLEAVATGKATIAQKLFNTVAKANPYVLLASAVLGVVSAIALFDKASKKASNSGTDFKKTASDIRSSFQSINESAISNIAKFQMLRAEWTKLSSLSEQKQFIKDNEGAFKDLGLAINNVSDAQNTLVNNGDKIVKLMIMQAEAAALAEKYQEEYSKYITKAVANINKQADKAKSFDPTAVFGNPGKYKKLLQEIGVTVGNGMDEVNETIYDENGKALQITKQVINDDGKRMIEEWARNASVAATNEFREGMTPVTDLMSYLQGEIAKKEKELGLLSKGGNKNDSKKEVKIEAESGSLVAAQKRVTDLQEKLHNMSPDNEKFAETKSLLEGAQKEVERIQDLLKTTKPADLFNEGSLSEANHFVTVFKNQLSDLNPDTEEFQEVNELLNIWLARQDAINKKINKTEESAKTVVERYQEIVSKANDISLQYKIGAIDKDAALAEIKELNRQLKDDLHLAATVDLELNDDVKTTNLDKFVEKFGTIKDKVGGVMSSISSAYDSISGLVERLSEEEDSVKRFFLAWEAGMNVVNAATTTLQALAPIINAITAATSAAAVAKKAEAKASEENAAANIVEAGSESKSAIAKMMNAIAGAAKAVASIPYVGPALAIAAAAGITALLISSFSKAKAQKFSQGGIYKAPYGVGDKNYARLNDGEMVLTTLQQKRLFKMLNSSGIIDNKTSQKSNSVQDVRFVIEGDKLVGLAQNHYRKINHARG